MRNFFMEAIKVDLFKDLKHKFYDILEYELIKAIEGETGIYWESDFHMNNIHNIKSALIRDVVVIKKLFNANLFELSMPEKFYYISETLTNYDLNQFETTEELFDDIIKCKAVLIDDGEHCYYASQLFGEMFNSDQEFKNIFSHNFKEYAECFFDTNEKLHTFIDDARLQFEEGKLTDESKFEVDEFILKHKPIFTLHPKFKISKIKNGKIKLTESTKEQIVILFEYLCEYGVFLKFDKKSKAYFASILTGLSEQTLRTKFIDNSPILNGKESSNPNDPTYDLKAVRDLTSSIFESLNKKIDKIQNK
jgi:hypothetical protein